jgi:hypothetical protein
MIIPMRKLPEIMRWNDDDATAHGRLHMTTQPNLTSPKLTYLHRILRHTIFMIRLWLDRN